MIISPVFALPDVKNGDFSEKPTSTRRPRFTNHDHERLVRVKYMDHLQFRNSRSTSYEPAVIEVVGWLTKETHEWIKVVCERHGKIRNAVPDAEIGFIICKRCILEMNPLRC